MRRLEYFVSILGPVTILRRFFCIFVSFLRQIAEQLFYHIVFDVLIIPKIEEDIKKCDEYRLDAAYVGKKIQKVVCVSLDNCQIIVHLED